MVPTDLVLEEKFQDLTIAISNCALPSVNSKHGLPKTLEFEHLNDD